MREPASIADGDTVRIRCGNRGLSARDTERSGGNTMQFADGAHDRILRLGGEGQAIIAGGLGIEAVFPKLIQPPAVADTA